MPPPSHLKPWPDHSLEFGHRNPTIIWKPMILHKLNAIKQFICTTAPPPPPPRARLPHRALSQQEDDLHFHPDVAFSNSASTPSPLEEGVRKESWMTTFNKSSAFNFLSVDWAFSWRNIVALMNQTSKQKETVPILQWSSLHQSPFGSQAWQTGFGSTGIFLYEEPFRVVRIGLTFSSPRVTWDG